MKKSIFIIAFCLLPCHFAFAQLPLAELDKVKQIKLLESTRDSDVLKIFAGYKLYFSDPLLHYERFASQNTAIEVRYSSGKCSAEWGEDWNVSEWKVTLIHIVLMKPVKIDSLGIDLLNYKKEKVYSNVADAYKYHNKALGIGFNVDKDEVDAVTLIPSKENYALLCNTKNVKKFYESQSWFSGKLKTDGKNRPILLILSV